MGLPVAQQETLAREVDLQAAQNEYDRAIHAYVHLTGLPTLPDPLTEIAAPVEDEQVLPADHPLLANRGLSGAMTQAAGEFLGAVRWVGCFGCGVERTDGRPDLISLIPRCPSSRKAFGIERPAPQAAGENPDPAVRREGHGAQQPPRPRGPAPERRPLRPLVAEGERVTVGQVLVETVAPAGGHPEPVPAESVTRLALAEGATEVGRSSLHREGVDRRSAACWKPAPSSAQLATRWSSAANSWASLVMRRKTVEQPRLRTPVNSKQTCEVHAPIAGGGLEQMVSTGQAVAAPPPLGSCG